MSGGASLIDEHNFRSTNSKDFKDASAGGGEGSSQNDEDEDEFFDAQDVFDKDVIEMLR